jgi:hypothetical protein
MDRREALKSLMALPGVGAVSVASLQPTDVIVIESDDWLTEKMVHSLRQGANQVWPNHKVVVLQHGMKLRAVRGE